ncbi:hypothetical protein KJ742_07745 [Patescibacteria group bacterium]|nr:hypothetical protein [Patescibacteria group bacterium]
MNWTMKGNPAEGDEISFCLESPTANKEASLVLAELTINRGDLSAVLRIGGDEHNVSSVKEMDDLLKARDLEELAT